MLRLTIVAMLVVTIAAAGGCSGSLASNPGSGGSGGGGGGSTATGGVGGSITDGGTCTLGTDTPQLWARGADPLGLSFDYDGPAFVATSTKDTLTLSISVPPDAGTSTDAGAGTTNVQITGMVPMPLFPAGARVWLTKSNDGMWWLGGQPPPSSFAVRDGQGGPLLFGGANGSYGPLSFPVQVDQLVATCTQRDEGCAPNSTISFAGAIVTGDKPAFIESDQLGTILLGGALYEVRLFAANEAVVPPVNCTDFFGISEVQVDVRATNLASLIAGLPVAVLLDAP
jgi:hypothetical protein